MPYGIANKTGHLDVSQTVAVVQTAWDTGIRTFDTAQAYGNSESMLGHALAELGVSRQAQIITKIDIPDKRAGTDILREIVTESISKLEISTLYGLMWHREQILDLPDQGLWTAMEDLVEEGLVRNWGISVYTPVRALQAIEKGIFTLLQVPAKSFGPSICRSGCF